MTPESHYYLFFPWPFIPWR